MISNPIGALLGGMMVDAVGRRLLLQSIVLPNLIGWLVIAFSETYVFLCVGRFITGFTIGECFCARIESPKLRDFAQKTTFETGSFLRLRYFFFIPEK